MNQNKETKRERDFFQNKCIYISYQADVCETRVSVSNNPSSPNIPNSPNSPNICLFFIIYIYIPGRGDA